MSNLSGNTNGLAPDFLSSLTNLANAVGGLTITSGFRDNATQTRLFNASDRSGKMVARPGHSNHEKGLAADISGNLPSAHANASKFGLVFPMSYEPWHIEPVGARSMAGNTSGNATDTNTVSDTSGTIYPKVVSKIPPILRIIEGAIGVGAILAGFIMTSKTLRTVAKGAMIL